MRWRSGRLWAADGYWPRRMLRLGGPSRASAFRTRYRASLNCRHLNGRRGLTRGLPCGAGCRVRCRARMAGEGQVQPAKCDQRKAPDGYRGRRSAPDFDLQTNGGGRARLKDFRGKKLVVYFYPADDTSGCTLEAIDFTNAVKDFAAADARFWGSRPTRKPRTTASSRSTASRSNWRRIPTRMRSAAYGVWGEKSLYGRKYMGVRARDLPDRREGRVAQRMAQGEGEGAHCRGAGSGPRPLAAARLFSPRPGPLPTVC